jgi:hypothetical protein
MARVLLSEGFPVEAEQNKSNSMSKAALCRLQYLSRRTPRLERPLLSRTTLEPRAPSPAL